MRPLVFGTAGLRGIMGLGTNRMNIHVIRHATPGVCRADRGRGRGSDEARRVRLPRLPQQRRGVRREAAAIMAANGVHVRIFESLRPTRS